MLLASGFANTVTDGPLLAAAGVAVLVGLIGFLSPCVLPLVPGYLSYVAALSGSDTARGGAADMQGSGGGVPDGDVGHAQVGLAVAVRPSQRRMVFGALLFVAGFSVIFIAQGALFGAFGAAIRDHQLVIERVLGVMTILMGLVFLGFLDVLQREVKIHRLPQPGLLGAPLLGAAFGLAWLPCLTPTFGAVYSMSFVQGTAARGAFLTFCYCLGLGVPFVLVALGFGWVTGALAFVRRHSGAVSRIGGVLLVVIGVLLVTGEWNYLMDELKSYVGPSSGIGSNL